MPAIVFDLDGTLIDSAPDIHAAVAAMLAAEGRPPLPLATVTAFIGNGVPVLVARVIAATGLPAGDHARLTEAFHAAYEADPVRLTQPYPGVRAALDAVRADGLALGICTNKPEGVTRDILARLGLAHVFGAVVGGDSLPVRKPDPAGLLACFGQLGAAGGLYVGDSEVDAETAERAEVPFGLFTRGYRRGPAEAMRAAFAFDDFAHLPDLVRRRA
jgi:phosphoglycolate phosphatase